MDDAKLMSIYYDSAFEPLKLIPGTGWQRWLVRFSFRFYDMTLDRDISNIVECEKYIKSIRCKDIGDGYIKESIMQSRYCIISLFDGIGLAFVLGDDWPNHDLYFSLSCAQTPLSNSHIATAVDKYKDWTPDMKSLFMDVENGKKGAQRMWGMKYPDISRVQFVQKFGDVQLGMGTILRAILVHYCFSHGYVNVYNDAAGADLIPYYARFGYRLGEKPCNTDDEITEWHNAHLDASIKTLETNAHKTNHGYRMKLCNHFDGKLLDYYKMKIEFIKRTLLEYPDIEMSNN